MDLGVHFYVLFMNSEIIKFFECFRDTLIEISEKGFPIQIPDELYSPSSIENSGDLNAITPFLKEADENLSRFFKQDPQKIIIAGAKDYLNVYPSISSLSDQIVASIPGKFDPSPQNLGKIVWYRVRMKLARTGEKALEDLAQAMNAKKYVSGIQDVWKKINEGKTGLMILENEYRLPGRINLIDQSLLPNDEPEITMAMDDIIDIVIDKVMESGGRVVFVENGLLQEQNRIAFIPQE